MDVLIQGAKAGQKQPKRPSIADDTIASISRLKALYLLSEGEIKGLANGAASIELEGTPLVDDSGNPNFEGVEWAIRTGTVDQEHIAGMPSASNEVGINTTLSSDTPYIRKISNTQLSSVNVNISFPLLKQVQDDGDVVGVTVAYAIDVQTDGMGYVTMLNTSLKAKTSGRYQKTHNIKLPEAQTSWQIRVRKITEDGNNETLFNAMQIDSMGEIIDVKLTYPCSALLYLSFDAKTFNNIPKIAVDTMGAYVQVPTNYDPVTRTSMGIWDGTFKLGYTTNPAWHHYNLVTNDRYGLGEKLQPFMIDKWALEYIARICDEPVDDGNGGTEPRFTCNLYLQKAEDAYQVLQHIAGIFRGMSFWNGSQIVVDADTARDCEYVITRANVVGGVFVKTGSAASDRHTIAKVAYSNPARNYETDYAMVRNEQAIAQYGINVLDLSAVGCTSEGQAYRMGLAALLAETNRTQSVSFAMGLDGSLPSVASRIDIADMMFTGANTGGRISTVSANRKVITVDRDNVPVTAGDKLIVNLESGKAQERVITSINGRAITVALAFDAVAAQNVWAINSDTMPTMPFIVMSVVQNEDGTQYNYTAMQYDPTMYSQIDNGTIIEQRPTLPSNNPYVINAPESVTLTSRSRVEQGINLTTLVITWAQVKDAVAYDVEWRKDDGDWIKLPRTGNISSEVVGIYSGNYLARVRAVSAFDAISKPTSSMLTNIKGKIGLPPAIVGLKATGVLFGMDLKWRFAQGSGDSDYTEIQVGSAPDVNVAALGQFSYPTNSHTINGLQGNLSQAYRSRLVDKLGNKSVWSAWVTGTTDASADKIMDLIQGEIDVSALDEALRSEIGKIDTNKTLLDNVSIDVSKAKTDIISAISKADAAKADAAANKVDLVAVNEAVANNKTAVEMSITTLTNKDISLTNLYTALQSEYATNKAKVVQDIKTLSDKDISLTSLLTALDSDHKGNKSSVANSLTTLSNKDVALTNSLNSLTSTVGGNSTAISTEANTRSSADSALSNRITTAQSKADSAFSKITTAETTIANNTQSIAQTKTELKADFNNIKIGGNNLLAKDSGIVKGYINSSTGIVTLTGNFNSSEDFISKDFIKVNEGDSYIFSYYPKDGITQTINNGAYFHYYNASKAWTHSDYKETGTGTSNNFKVTISNSSYIKVVGRGFNQYNHKLELGTIPTDYSKSLDDISENISANTASITSESITRADKDSALSGRIDTIYSRANGNSAAIQTVQKAVADNESAIASSTNTLRAEISNIDIGGTNLVSSQQMQYGYINASTGEIVLQDSPNSAQDILTDYIKVNRGDALIASIYPKNNTALKDINTNIYIHQFLNNKTWVGGHLKGGDAGVVNQFKYIATHTGYIRMSAKGSLQHDFKIEKGLYPTGWTPAPEDVTPNANLFSLNDCIAGYENNGNITSTAHLPKIQTMQTLVPVIGGEDLILQCWNPNKVDTNHTNRVAFFTSSKKYITSEGSITPNGNAYIKVVRSVPSNAKWARIGFVVGADSIDTSIYFKAEQSFSTSWTPSAIDSSSSAAAIQETKEVVAGVSAQYTLKLDVGGRISGFGLMSSATQSEFAVNADRFWIAPPTGTSKGKSPFMVLTSPQTINGTVVPAGTYIDSTFIHKAAIDTAQIKDAAIKTAQIDNLAVDTLQIADFAVTIPRLRSYDGDVVINNTVNNIVHPDSYTYPSGMSINSKGTGGVMIQINYEHILAIQGYQGSGQGHELRVDIRRNSTVIKTYITKLWTTKIFDQIDIYMAALPPFLDESPPKGDNFYSIRAYAINAGDNKVALKLSNMTLFIMGVKK